jgi:glycosyltransferase involved in cell wall biosynthesis
LRATIGRQASDWLRRRANAYALKRIHADYHPDLVHLYQIDRRAYDCHLAGIRPLVMSSWGTDINQHFAVGADPSYRSQTARALAGADLVIADAADIIAKCEALAGRRLASAILALGIDTRLFRSGYEESAAAFRARAGIPRDSKVLFSMRALTPLYNHESVLEAFALALPRFKPETYLVFKSYNDQAVKGYRDQLREVAHRLQVSDRVRWVGQVAFEELPGLYAAADVILNYPTIDGFPVTFLEAAACERTVISVGLPAYSETFAEEYFRLVPPGDLKELADAMIQVVNDGPALECLAAGREAVVRSFSEEESASRLMGIYDRLVDALRPSASQRAGRCHQESVCK